MINFVGIDLKLNPDYAKGFVLSDVIAKKSGPLKIDTWCQDKP